MCCADFEGFMSSSWDLSKVYVDGRQSLMVRDKGAAEPYDAER